MRSFRSWSATLNILSCNSFEFRTGCFERGQRTEDFPGAFICGGNPPRNELDKGPRLAGALHLLGYVCIAHPPANISGKHCISRVDEDRIGLIVGQPQAPKNPTIGHARMVVLAGRSTRHGFCDCNLRACRLQKLNAGIPLIEYCRQKLKSFTRGYWKLQRESVNNGCTRFHVIACGREKNRVRQFRFVFLGTANNNLSNSRKILWGKSKVAFIFTCAFLRSAAATGI